MAKTIGERVNCGWTHNILERRIEDGRVWIGHQIDEGEETVWELFDPDDIKGATDWLHEICEGAIYRRANLY